MILSRRMFMKTMAYSSVLALTGCGVESDALRRAGWQGADEYTSNTRLRNPAHKTIAFEHTHTGEKLKLTYFEHGRYVKDALHEINYLLRDYHTDEVHPIDTALIDQLFDLKKNLAINQPFQIVSGYRSPATNARLRAHTRGVAKHSLHMQGKAIDIRLHGVSPKTIRKTALAMAQGGVGYYPRENFIHLDTGRFRTW